MKTKLLLELVECTKVVILNNLLLLKIIYNLFNLSIMYCRFNCGFCSKLIERGILLKSMTCSFQQFYCYVLEIIKILSQKIFEICTSIVEVTQNIYTKPQLDKSKVIHKYTFKCNSNQNVGFEPNSIGEKQKECHNKAISNK